MCTVISSHQASEARRMLAAGAVACFAMAALRRWSLRWGATAVELESDLPGDELLTTPNLVSTRAITIEASVDVVWPWIVQLGQGRGGFYSYDRLENLLGCDIHSADEVMPEWQHLSVGEPVRLAPEVALYVARVDPERALVLRGGVPMGTTPAPYDFTWAFVLSATDGRRTRLVVRERYAYTRWWTGLMVEPMQLISLVMTQRMLRGIRYRATRSQTVSPPNVTVRRQPGGGL